jgi:excisionase family DNA binding protein
MIPQLLEAADVAQALKVSKGCVYQMIRTGELPAVKFGKSVRVRPQDLEAFIVDNLTSNSVLDEKFKFAIKKRKVH